MNRDIINAALVAYRAEADNRKEETANHDGGSQEMFREAQAFEMGLDNVLPVFLEPYVKEVMRQRDPEFADYLRLKKKFA